MKTAPFYRTVCIESENDLPKEESRYFVYTKEYQKDPDVYYWFPNDIECRKMWLNEIYWYLQPISEEEYIADKLANIDIEKAARAKHPYLKHIINSLTEVRELYIEGANYVINKLKEK